MVRPIKFLPNIPKKVINIIVIKNANILGNFSLNIRLNGTDITFINVMTSQIVIATGNTKINPYINQTLNLFPNFFIGYS